MDYLFIECVDQRTSPITLCAIEKFESKIYMTKTKNHICIMELFRGHIAISFSDTVLAILSVAINTDILNTFYKLPLIFQASLNILASWLKNWYFHLTQHIQYCSYL